MGLPGSGKSTLSNLIQKYLSADWHNADLVREAANDWDFTPQGRQRQAERMRNLSLQSVQNQRHALADFVCPTPELRAEFAPDYTVFMNTIDSSRFTDTNQIFQAPDCCDYEITGWQDAQTLDLHARQIACDIQQAEFNPEQPTVQMLGRWQPWHSGHRALFERALTHADQVAILVRSTPRDHSNPLDFAQVKWHIQNDLVAHAGKFIVQQVPNITHISYGRDVGYSIQQEVFDEQTHAVSATKIRQQLRDQGLL
jgi:hypothetical protein